MIGSKSIEEENWGMIRDQIRDQRSLAGMRAMRRGVLNVPIEGQFSHHEQVQVPAFCEFRLEKWYYSDFTTEQIIIYLRSPTCPSTEWAELWTLRRKTRNVSQDAPSEFTNWSLIFDADLFRGLYTDNATSEVDIEGVCRMCHNLCDRFGENGVGRLKPHSYLDPWAHLDCC